MLKKRFYLTNTEKAVILALLIRIESLRGGQSVRCSEIRRDTGRTLGGTVSKESIGGLKLGLVLQSINAISIQ